jgi:hypothetical protein
VFEETRVAKDIVSFALYELAVLPPEVLVNTSNFTSNVSFVTGFDLFGFKYKYEISRKSSV